MTRTWSWIQPLPESLALTPEVDRVDPRRDEHRATLHALVDGPDWPALSWTALIERLLQLGRTDIALSRLAEGHIDAQRILAQAGARPVPGALYGVWASRSMRTGVRGTVTDDVLTLAGALRFASGAGVIDRALVPVWVEPEHHVLVDLDVAELAVDASGWRTGAMGASRTYDVAVEGVRVPQPIQVGELDFYLARPGFFPGGVGVAACWAGGAARVLDVVAAALGSPSPSQRVRLGRMRTELVAATSTVRGAAAFLDSPAAGSADLMAVASEARAAVAEAVRRLLAQARVAVGPAGLALDDDVAHAIPDLELYVLQQNSDADAALLGDPERWV